MNIPYSRKEETNETENNPNQSKNTLGPDINEQVMNGMYGMLESNFEDRNSEGNWEYFSPSVIVVTTGK